MKRYGPHLFVASFALLAILMPGLTTSFLQQTSAWFLRQFDWLTLLVASISVVFCLGIAVSPVGEKRIGGEAARPEFRTVTWLAMLFAAGMGAGLVFWGAAEPLIHTVTPPPGSADAGSDAARTQALAITQFHWSIHAWSVYAVAALAVAIFSGHGQSPLPSSPFPQAPLKARRLIDWVALVAVLFGVVASLGQGAFQMGAGVGRISGGTFPSGTGSQILLLILLTLAFLASAAAGLRKGIAILSNINMVLALALAVFVFVAGPTGDIIQTFWQSLLAYGRDFFALSTELREEGAARQWTRDWSLTYFLWWVAWTPFVGVFVARISRGRTLREFVLGVVLVPSFVTLIWFSIFGGTALSLDAQGIDLGVRDFRAAQEASYAVLENLPFATLSQIAAFLLVFIFMLTSADSGAYVLGMLSTGKDDPPVAERLFWGGILAVVSGAAILSEDGQLATRAFAVSGAIPLVMLLLGQMISTIWHRGHRPPAG